MAGSREAAEGRSSIGRAPVSKTGGWGFESLRPCRSRSSGVERILGKDEVAGSNPAASLEYERRAPVAQLDQSTGLLSRGSQVRVLAGAWQSGDDGRNWDEPPSSNG